MMIGHARRIGGQWWSAALCVALAMLAAACQAPSAGGPVVTAVTGQQVTMLRLEGLDRRDLAALDTPDWSVEHWQQLWRIQDPDVPASPDASASEVPTLAGTYVAREGGVLFVPAAPLKSGATYTWVFFPRELPSSPADSTSRQSWRQSTVIRGSAHVP